jgi:hypothetical protein
MEESGQLHALAALPLGKEPLNRKNGRSNIGQEYLTEANEMFHCFVKI